MGLRLCETAERPGFHCPDEHVFQNVHWGLELVLKAYLRARGWADARCIADIRHDIALSLAVCEQEGLKSIDDQTRALIRALSPFSRRHGIAEFVSTGAGGYAAAQAIVAARQICSSVVSALSKEP